MNNKFLEFNLEETIIKALCNLDYNTPTNVQEKVIPAVLQNKDIITKAQTGTGKTASYVIPVCQNVKWELNNAQALVLAPTRELAIQINEDVKNIGRYKRIKSTLLYGKSPFKDQANDLKGKNHIAIGTPGRVLDHLERGTFDVSKVKYLVIDEADLMLNMGFIKQVSSIIRRLPKNHVTLLFSATFPYQIKELSDKYMKNPVFVEIESTNILADNVEHGFIKVEASDKLEILRKYLIIEKPETAVVFCSLRETVDKVYDYLKQFGYSVNKIHGAMMQNDRTLVMDNFKNGDFRILVATDLASRGIDVLGISHVVNYDPPLEKEVYVHRLGRTARAGKSGKAIMFIKENQSRRLRELEEYINLKINEIDINDFNQKYAQDLTGDEILKKKPKTKSRKDDKINKDISKIFFNGGKKKKIRALDFVGALSSIDGIDSDDIGIIEIKDSCSYVEILNGKGKKYLEQIENITVKGKNLRAEIAKK